jgi:membrane protein
MSSHARERAREDGRGRRADSPAEMPPLGWKDIGLRTLSEIGEDRVTLVAAGVTYYLLLALFPTITAFVSIYGLFADPATVRDHVSMLAALVPAGGLAVINDQLERLASEDAPTLGFALLLSLGIALWSASAGVKSMFEAMNVAYDEDEKRNVVVLSAIGLLFTLAGIVGALVMLGVVVALPLVFGFLGLGKGFEWLLQIAGYVLMVVVLLVGLAALYRFGPSRRQAKWRWITPGALAAALAILVVSALFSWYAANFANFDKTYGSLGALVGLLTWMWLTVTAVIAGAELNSEIEHQTARDSTVGRPRPMGARQARMADTLGAASDDTPIGEDDPRAGRSAEWVAGFEAGRHHARHPEKPLPLAYALPAALAVTAMEAAGKREA